MRDVTDAGADSTVMVPMSTTQLPTLAALADYVEATLASLSPHPQGATVVALIGDLGVGKTTFTQSVAKLLGVTDVVTSPTYLIMRSYATTHDQFATLVHIDAYRIESLAELAPLRFSEVLGQSRTLVCIEWADRIKDVLPPHTRYFELTLRPDGTRTISSSE